MDYKKTIKLGASITTIGALLIVIFEYFDIVICPRAAGKGIFCVYDAKIVAEPLFFFLAALVPVFIILIFTKQQVFTTWKKFAIPYLIISAIILLIPSGGMGGFMGGGPDNEFFTIMLSGLFLIISILIIAIKSYKLRKKEKQIQN